MGVLDIFRGKLVDPTTYPGVHGGGDIITTTVDAVVKWGRKSSIWPMPFGTACCAIEFMALTASHYDLARFGAEVLRFSPRQADLMFVAGTIVDKEAPVLKTIYDQMPEPKWVISMGVCASSGGFYRSYHVMQGIDEIIPVDVYVPGCPPSPEALIAAVMKIQERIKNGEQAGRRRARTGWACPATAPSTAARASRPGRRTTRSAREQGLPPRGVISVPRAAARAAAKDEPRAWLAPPRRRLPRPRRRRGRATPPRASSPSGWGRRCARVEEFRGDLAITVERGAWVEAVHAAARPPRARLQALPRPVRRGLARPERTSGFEVVLPRLLGHARSTTCG